MSRESLNRTSDAIENPSQYTERKNNIVELGVLKKKAEVIKVPSKIRNVSKKNF